MAVRAKFICTGKTTTPENGSTITFSAVVNGSDENRSFFKWTPSGSLTLQTVNDAAADQLEQGKEYYIDLTPAE